MFEETEVNAPALYKDMGTIESRGNEIRINILGHGKMTGFKFKRMWDPLRTFDQGSEMYSFIHLKNHSLL